MAGLLVGSVQAAPAVQWRFPEYPRRAIFQVPVAAGTGLVLRVDREGGMPVSREGFLACGPDGSVLPLGVIHAEADEVILAMEAPRSKGFQGEVYYGASPTNGPVTSPETDAEADPLAVGIMRLGGRAIPNSWERLRYLIKVPLGQIKTPFLAAGFEGIAEAMDQGAAPAGTPGKPERKRDKGGVQLATVRSFLLCPRGGTYRFAVDCRDAGFVLVDGDLVATWPGEHASGAWQVGGPVSLKPGVHRVEVFNAYDGGDPYLRVGWVQSGGQEIVSLAAPDLVAPFEAMEVREERLGRTIQPGFVATPVRAYTFRGNPADFVEVSFRNITQDWVGSKVTARWKFGDGTRSEEKEPVHVFAAADLFKVSLEVRDELGFVAACSDSVDCRQVPPEEYAVSCDMTGIPAVCFERDTMAPFLRVQGAGPAGSVFEVSWEVRFRSGVAEKGQRTVTQQGLTQLIPLAPVAVRDLESLNWQVSHHQVRLGGERIRFMRPPFATLPDRIEGDRLYDAGGTRLVLIPEEGRATFRQAAPTSVRRFGKLVCVDDSLAVAGLVEAGGDAFDRILARLLKGRMEAVRYAALPGWDQFPGAFGPVRKLIDVPAALRLERADVAILSIGLQDMLVTKDVDHFERMAAALSDVVAASMKIRTVWVTPPPYPSDPDRSRVFAAVIRRIAEARGIPVADLYTAFRCASDRRHVFFSANPLVLSEQGQRLAGQEIVRVLMEEPK
jgi:hypothetical protein